jgi:hypothetical protein
MKSIQVNERLIVVQCDTPLETYYHHADDPYLAKFGVDGRMAEIKKSVFLSLNVCITELVKHIYEESKLLFAARINQDDWYFWHDMPCP